MGFKPPQTQIRFIKRHNEPCRLPTYSAKGGPTTRKKTCRLPTYSPKAGPAIHGRPVGCQHTGCFVLIPSLSLLYPIFIPLALCLYRLYPFIIPSLSLWLCIYPVFIPSLSHLYPFVYITLQYHYHYIPVHALHTVTYITYHYIPLPN